VRTAVIAGAVSAAALALGSPAFAAPPLKVETSVAPSWPSFADPITAEVTIVVDRRKIDPRSVRVEASFGPWHQESETRISSGNAGQLAIRTWRFTLTCLDPVCLPGTEPLQVRLPPAAATATTLRGEPLTGRGAWPEFWVTGRVPPASASKTPFELQTALPPASYRASPTGLALALDALAALAAVAGIALVAFEVARRQRAQRAPADNRSPLARALAYVREAQGRRTDDRRRAAGLLARTLGRDSGGLDAAASRVAWSAEEPSPARLEELARSVEAKVEKPA
jgi:hypothetical protein